MTNIEKESIFVSLLNQHFVWKLFLFLLLYSLVPILGILYLGGELGNYLTLALAAYRRLTGMLVAITRFSEAVTKLREAIRSGNYPRQEFMEFSGLPCESLMLLTPGFVTDIIGSIILFSTVRNGVGKFVTARVSNELRERFEYLKLYDL